MDYHHATFNRRRTGGHSLHHPHRAFFQLTLAVFWLLAFSSATHDIAADGFYMLALDSHRQALFVGIRSTFYRIATIAGQGLLIMLAGRLEIMTDNIPYAWSLTFLYWPDFSLEYGFIISLFFPVRIQIILPRSFRFQSAQKVLWYFCQFLSKKQAGIAILFMLLYRLPEAQLAKCAFLSL